MTVRRIQHATILLVTRGLQVCLRMGAEVTECL